MANPRKDTPLQRDTHRSLWIGAGVQFVALVLAYFVGGTFFPYLFLFLGLVLIVRGWKPSVFTKHIEAQILAGIPDRREESIRAWVVAWSVSLVLAFTTSWVHLKVAPQKPDLATAIITEIDRLFTQEKMVPMPAPGPSVMGSPPPSLLDLFNADLLTASMKFNEDRIGIKWKDGSVLPIKSAMYASFPAKVKFVGFYIPDSPRTFEACMILVESVLPTIQSVQSTRKVRAGYRDEGTILEDRAFSGRVLLYHDDFLSIPQKAALIQRYSIYKFAVQFRGPDYLGDQVMAWHHRHDVKEAH